MAAKPVAIIVGSQSDWATLKHAGTVHLYRKTAVRAGRKMGPVTRVFAQPER